MPGASFLAQIIQMVWFKGEAASAGVGIKVLSELFRDSDSQESKPSISGGRPCKGFASTP